MNRLTLPDLPDAPKTPDAYVCRLIASGCGLQEARAIASDAEARGAFTPPTPATPAYDPDDTAAGAGWSIVVLHYDGRGEVLTAVPTYGAAVELASAYRRASLDVDARRRPRFVVVPSYDADVVAGRCRC